MGKNLDSLREKWEGSSEVVAEVATEDFVASVNKKGDAYWVFRYFKMGGWQVSVDLSHGTADEAFKAYTKAVQLKF